LQLSLSDNALTILQARYLRRDPSGQLVETPEELFRRVARAVAQAEAKWGEVAAVGKWEEKFLDALTNFDFLPNSPTLMNAGTSLGQLSACFVLAVEDSMESIFDSLKLMALIQQSGGGTGFSFSRLRPRGDVVATTGGTSSGPVSFMRIFDLEKFYCGEPGCFSARSTENSRTISYSLRALTQPGSPVGNSFCIPTLPSQSFALGHTGTLFCRVPRYLTRGLKARMAPVSQATIPARPPIKAAARLLKNVYPARLPMIPPMTPNK
jgi:ribonucleoside-diphosphate reductase alpha chain